MFISPPFLPRRYPTTGSSPYKEWLKKSGTEGEFAAGMYLLSEHAEWHGGVHLTAPSVTQESNEKLPVCAIAPGVVIYKREREKADSADHPLNYHNGYTSNGVVILKHEQEIQGEIDTNTTKTITFFSIYMHLDTIHSKVIKGKEIPRKAKLGTAGHLAGETDKLHLEVIIDEENIKKLIGRDPGKLDSSKNERTDARFGALHYYIPSGINIYPEDPRIASTEYTPKTGDTFSGISVSTQSTINILKHINGIATDKTSAQTDAWLKEQIKAKKPIKVLKAIIEAQSQQDAAALSPTAQTGTTQIVSISFDRGHETIRTVSDDGTELSPAVEKTNAEHTIRKDSEKFFKSSPKAGAELLRFGKIVGSGQLHNDDQDIRLSRHLNTKHVAVRDADGTIQNGWIDLNDALIKKFSDADFPDWAGWKFISDDESDDSRSDSKNLASLLGLDPDKDYFRDNIATALESEITKKRLRRAILKASIEWNTEDADIERRYGWLKQKSEKNPQPYTEDDYKKLSDHVKKMGFWEEAVKSSPKDHPLPDGGNLWRFHPMEFISFMRKAQPTYKYWAGVDPELQLASLVAYGKIRDTGPSITANLPQPSSLEHILLETPQDVLEYAREHKTHLFLFSPNVAVTENKITIRDPITVGENYRPIRNGHFNARLTSLKDGNLVGVFDARTRPSSNDYKLVNPGVYWAIPGQHHKDQSNRYSAFRVMDGGNVPSTRHNLNINATGINIHLAGDLDKTTMTNAGTPISEGCSMLPESDFNSLRNFYFAPNQMINGISFFPNLHIFTIYAGH